MSGVGAMGWRGVRSCRATFGSAVTQSSKWPSDLLAGFGYFLHAQSPSNKSVRLSVMDQIGDSDRFP